MICRGEFVFLRVILGEARVEGRSRHVFVPSNMISFGSRSADHFVRTLFNFNLCEAMRAGHRLLSYVSFGLMHLSRSRVIVYSVLNWEGFR